MYGSVDDSMYGSQERLVSLMRAKLGNSAHGLPIFCCSVFQHPKWCQGQHARTWPVCGNNRRCTSEVAVNSVTSHKASKSQEG